MAASEEHDSMRLMYPSLFQRYLATTIVVIVIIVLIVVLVLIMRGRGAPKR
jgi:hypothetical protein